MRSNQRCGAVTSSIASTPPWREQLANARERAAQVGRGVDDVRRDDDVERRRLQALGLGLTFEIENLEAHEGMNTKALARPGHEERADVGEGVLDVRLGEARHHMGRGAARARADLQDAQWRGRPIASRPPPSLRPPGRCRTLP